MATIVAPIQEPVTGREDTSDTSNAQHALAQFYKALNGRDLTLMEQNWENSPEAAMDNPLGGIKRGWSEIRQVYERLFGAAVTYRFEFWDYTFHEAGDIFWVVGRERGELQRGDRVLKLAIRTTRMFRRTDGRWHQVHHHGSIEDPKMLEEYQQLVR